IVDALPVETQAEQEPVEVLIGALRDKHTLLILDNVEHVSRGAADVAALQAMLPDLDILATSRTPLRTPLEWAFEVPQLSLQDLVGSLSAAQIGQNPAIAMFVECATRARPDFTLSDGNARAVAEICQRLEGLPLAIELAAARVRLVPPQVLLSRLGSRLSLLTRSADTSGRHRTLQETIAWSYDLLSAEQQILFRTMGAFRGASALEAIQAVVGEDGGPDNVGTLVDHSLVRQSPPGLESEPRYSMLETIREYALLLLDKMEESAETHERHARYFAAHSREAAQDIARSATKQSLLALRADDANVQAALEWFTSTGDHGAAIAVLTDLYSYWVRTGRTHDASRKLAESLELAENLRQSLAGRAAFDLGRYAAMHGDADLASRMMECAQQSALAADDRVLAANVYFELGRTCERQSHLDEAAAHYQASASLYRDVHLHREEAEALHSLGVLNIYRGDFPAAVTAISESVAEFRRLGDVRLVAEALSDLGAAEMLADNARSAQKHLQDSLSIFRTLDDAMAVAVLTTNLGRAQQISGDLEAASKTLSEALLLTREAGDRANEAVTLYGLGLFARATGDFSGADRNLRDALDLAWTNDDHWLVVQILEAFAHLSIERGEVEAALPLYGAAKAMRDEAGTAINPSEQREYDHALDLARRAVGETRLQELIDSGRSADLPKIVARVVGTA
ncbi:MAG: tetratricopeptide repeat protein, partial [Thermomicrobiales bacterium]